MSKTIRILICDDDPIVHQSLSLYLDNEDFLHDSAYDGRQALDMIKKEHYDLMLNTSGRDIKKTAAVIATGGSVVYSQAGMEALKRNGDVVYLAATYAEVEKRVTNITTRGIVLKHGCSLQDAFAERVPLYEQYSDYTVDGTGKSIEECVEEIVGLFH